MWTLTKTEYRAKLADTMKRLAEHSTTSFLIVDATSSNYEIYYCNDSFLNLMEYTQSQIENQSYLNFIQFNHEGDFETFHLAIQHGDVGKYSVYHTKNESQLFEAELICYPFQNDDLETEYVLIEVQDITHQMLNTYASNLERKLFRAIEQEKTIYEKIELICRAMDQTLGPDCFTSIVIHIEKQLYITSTLEIESSTTHLIPKGMANSYYKLLMNLDTSKVFKNHKGYPLSAMHQQHALDKGFNSCWQIPIPIYTGEIIGVITIFFLKQEKPKTFYDQYITKVITLLGLAYTYEMKQQQIHRLAYTDLSTGLSNRHDLIRKLQVEKEGTVLIIQPTDLSKLRELYGRNFGEALLLQLATKLQRNNAITIVAQFSSSSLAVHVKHILNTEEDVRQVLMRVVEGEYSVAGHRIYTSLKVGVASLNGKTEITTVCKNAENALSNAKSKSGEQIIFYNEMMEETLKKEVILLNEMVEALRLKQFKVYVQPKIETYRGRICGLEALARWHSPNLGVVPPNDFIPIAEKAGLIRTLDLQIVEQVVSWMQARQYEGKPIYPVSINISPEHFYHPDFIKDLMALVTKYYADPNYITIEVIESISLVDIERAQYILNKLRAYGFHTSVDDFGVGYSSLSYLQNLQFTELKLDRSFSKKIEEAATKTIVKSITEISTQLNMIATAEGIETKEQYNLVKELGCSVVQGYYFYKPMPIENINKL